VTEAQILLGEHLKELKLGKVEYEYQFCEDRQWRADIAIRDARLLFECDGGLFRGGHKRGRAMETDYERGNRAQVEGWRLFRFSNRQVLTGEALAWLKEWLGK
jgi:very-short-patch-repair endonuclease